jgi:hypothetical protein
VVPEMGGSPFSDPHRIKGVNDAIPFEVAQLETLTRRMDDWQRGGLWLWLNGGFLSYGTLSQRSGSERRVNRSCFTLCSKNFGQYY